MSKYHDKQIGGLKVDVYRVLRLFGITDPAIQHAVKKLLRCGRGQKDAATDIEEAIQSLRRWQEMNREDAGAIASRKLTVIRNPKAKNPGLDAYHFERRGAELSDVEGYNGACL